MFLNLQSNNYMANIEKLTAYHSIKSYLSEEDQSALVLKLGLDPSNLDLRLQGLRNEDEFCLILYFLECCNHIIKFDEGVSFLSKSYSPDMLLELSSGEKYFIEIKTKTNESKFKISGGNLEKRLAFASDFGFPLLFAIKLNGYWGLFTGEYLQNTSGKIKFPDDFNRSMFNQKFKSTFYVFPKGIKIESEYSQGGDPVGKIQHSDYGNLISYKFSYKDNLIFEATKEDKRKIHFSFLLEHLHDVMSNQSQTTETKENGNTVIKEELTQDFACSDYAFFLAPIQHTISNLGTKFDNSSFYKSMLEDRDDRLIKKLIHDLISYLKDLGIPIIITNKITLNSDGTFKTEIKF
jgi:hypothetical protein